MRGFPQTALAGAFWAILSSSAAAQAPLPEADAVSMATELEAAGRFAEAAEKLAPLVVRYPEDYALQMRVAWDYYRAEHFVSALRHYEAAKELSGGSSESHLGLGWTLLELERCRDAAAHFAAIPEGAAEHALAQDGRAVCDARIGSRVAVELGAVGHLYQDHPYLKSGLGGFVSADGVVNGVFLIGATYRLTALESVTESSPPAPGPGPGPSFTSTTVSVQNEVHGRVGLRWGGGDGEVTLAYGYVASDVPQLLSPMHSAGALLRLRPWGEIVVEASGTFASDTQVLRLAPSWWLPVTSWLSLRPGAVAQWAVDGDGYGAGDLTVLFHGAIGSVWLGGRVGSQYRPAFLEQAVIYNIEDVIREGAWVGGSLRMGAGLSLRVDYELQRRVALDAGGNDQEAWAHFGVLRLRWESR